MTAYIKYLGDQRSIKLEKFTNDDFLLKKDQKIDLIYFDSIPQINLKLGFLQRPFHFNFLESVTSIQQLPNNTNIQLIKVLQYCPSLKFFKTYATIRKEDEKFVTSLYNYMRSQISNEVNIFMAGYSPYNAIIESIPLRRIAYVICLAARYCHSVFYIYTERPTNPLIFKYAMTSVDLMNRHLKPSSRGIYLGMHLQLSGDINFSDFVAIFPIASLLRHPRGQDSGFRRVKGRNMDHEALQY